MIVYGTPCTTCKWSQAQNLYAIAVQRMLTYSFGAMFGLFSLSYVFGFHVLFDDFNTFVTSISRTFQIMMGITNYANTNFIRYFLHVAFIFMVVYLLLNILIVILTSSFGWAYKHRRILLTVLCLSVTLTMEPVMARLIRRFHNYLRKRYLVFENDKVYVTNSTGMQIQIQFRKLNQSQIDVQSWL